MRDQEEKSGKRMEDVIPEKFRNEFLILLDSLENFDTDIRKILFKMDEEEKEIFLAEWERWTKLGMQEVYYNEKYIKPRESYSRHLAEWDLKCALAEDHISLHVEDYEDYVDENEYPATDVWIDRKKQELSNFYNQHLPILLGRPKFTIKEEQTNKEEEYSFPTHLRATDLLPTNLIDDSFRISTAKSYADLQELLKSFREVLEPESFEALIHNMFQFPENPSKTPIVLELRARNKKNRGPLKHEFFMLYENFYSYFNRDIDKEVFGKILFSNFREDRKSFIEKRKDFRVHLENLTKSVRKDPKKLS